MPSSKATTDAALRRRPPHTAGSALRYGEDAPADGVSTSAGLARFSRKPTTATALPWVVIRAVAHKKNPDAHLVRTGRQPLKRRGLGQRHQCSSCARELPVRTERTIGPQFVPIPVPTPPACRGGAAPWTRYLTEVCSAVPGVADRHAGGVHPGSARGASRGREVRDPLPCPVDRQDNCQQPPCPTMPGWLRFRVTLLIITSPRADD
jgi:hypothetical protein